MSMSLPLPPKLGASVGDIWQGYTCMYIYIYIYQGRLIYIPTIFELLLMLSHLVMVVQPVCRAVRLPQSDHGMGLSLEPLINIFFVLVIHDLCGPARIS